MYKYSLFLFIALAILNDSQAQTISNKSRSKIIAADFERIKDAIPEMENLYRMGTMHIKALQSNDSTAAFQIEETAYGDDIVADNQKEWKELISPAKKVENPSSIYMLISYTQKDKTLKVRPPKKDFYFPDYGVTWKLTVKKIKEKQTELVLTYESLSPEFKQKIDKEFKSDTYFKNVINKIAVNDKMLPIIENLLIKELRVDRDPPAPMAAPRLSN
ncbi:transcriptional regulator [Sphingobacterium spiritivorum]|uniref:transcriptional regulator n=1 Tax=Sphingobacterium spiritivorum TaxID=258 RepID=UPI003DA55944